MVHIEGISGGHHRSSNKQVREDVDLIEKVKYTILTTMMNPFASMNNSDMENIATGEKNPSIDIIFAKAKGIAAMKKAQETGSTKIISPEIKCFTQTKKSGQSKKQIIPKVYQEESAVSRTSCFIQKSSETARKEAFAHEWTPYPSSLFQPDLKFLSGFSMPFLIEKNIK